MSEKDLCQRCLMRWREGLSCEIPPWVHCHHDQPGPQATKEEAKPCQWCAAWRTYQKGATIFLTRSDGSPLVEYVTAAHYLITLGKYMQVCPVCDARLEGK